MGAPARAFYEEGLVRFTSHDFVRAIGAFEAGYAVEPRREFLFAEAQAFRLDGDCPRATLLYRQFLATHPPAIQVEATELGLARCAPAKTTGAAALARGRGAPPATTSVTAAPLPLSLPAPPARPPSTARRLLDDPWTTVPLGSGLLALGAGLSFWVAAEQARAQTDASHSPTYDDFANASQRFEQRRAIAVAALSAGAGLVLCGIARAWWRSERRPGGPRATLAFDGQRLWWSAAY